MQKNTANCVFFWHFGVFGVNFVFWVFTLYLPNLVYWVGFVTGIKLWTHMSNVKIIDFLTFLRNHALSFRLLFLRDISIPIYIYIYIYIYYIKYLIYKIRYLLIRYRNIAYIYCQYIARAGRPPCAGPSLRGPGGRPPRPLGRRPSGPRTWVAAGPGNI